MKPSVFNQIFHHKKIILGVTGGITAYKTAFLIRLLTEAGAQVQVVVTRAALDFVGRATFQALSGRPVWGPDFADDARAMPHIDLSRDADVLVIAPCSANMMAKLAHGIADDLLSTLCVARRADLTLLLAPSMNVEMWHAAATQRNLESLISDGTRLVGPEAGVQACGDVGLGRMSEPTDIMDAIAQALSAQTLCGQSIVITAGPTFEALDPVRGITNRSSGKMGYALARACQYAGAKVHLISGPTALPQPYGVDFVSVEGAQQMYEAVHAVVSRAQIFISVAAIADWRVQNAALQKIKKNAGHNPFDEMVWCENPDILASVAALPNAPYCVGFAAESHDVVNLAAQKRVRKNIPLIIANCGPDTFGQDRNQVVLIDDARQVELLPADKNELAIELVAQIATRFYASLIN